MSANGSTGTAGSLIAFVMRHVRCAACGASYRLEDVHVEAHQGAEWLLQATCATCATRQVIHAFDTPPYQRLTLPPLTGDDVRDWAQWLAGFTGDFRDLLAAHP